MTTKDRRPHELHDTREKILDAARDMFAHEGYESVTMRAIAERIELTPTAIYHHFKSKDALLTELCQADFWKLAQHFNTSVVPADPVERILTIGEAYLQFAEQHPSQYRFMFMTVIPPSALGEEYVASTRGIPERDAYAFLRDACREAVAAGRLRPEMTNPDEVAQMLWGGVHGMISLHIVKSHEGWVEWCDLRSSATKLMIAMLRGLLKNPAEAPTRP